MKQSNHRHTAHGHIKKTSESENRQVKVNTNKNKLVLLTGRYYDGCGGNPVASELLLWSYWGRCC